MVTNAIVRRPCENIVRGISRQNKDKPNYTKSLQQHDMYIAALRKCGLNVQIIPDSDEFPDSVFIEDVALCKDNFIIYGRSGELTRRDEVLITKTYLDEYFDEIYQIEAPCTIDMGDVLEIDGHFYIGLSERTNLEGAEKMVEILENKGLYAEVVPSFEPYHLKTWVSYLSNNNLLVSGKYVDCEVFRKYNLIKIDKENQYAANCICVNNTVIVPKGYNKVKNLITNLNYEVIEVETSEFYKIDGSLTCMSIIW